MQDEGRPGKGEFEKQLQREYDSNAITEALMKGWQPFGLITAIKLWIEFTEAHLPDNIKDMLDPEIENYTLSTIGLVLVKAIKEGRVYKLVQGIYETDADNYLLEYSYTN